MSAFTLALHLPLLLLRVLRLALPVAPFVRTPTSLPPWGLPSGSSKHPSNCPRPARRPQASAAQLPLSPANPTHSEPTPRPASDTPKHAPPHLKSFLEKLLLRARHPKTHPIRHPTPPAPSPSPTNRSPSSSVSSPPLPPSPSTSPFSPISPLFSLLAPLHSVLPRRGFSGQCATSHPRRLSPPRTSSKPRQNTPRATSRVFWKKTLIAREAPAQHPANTPSVPAPSPGPSAGHMPHARGTCQPIPVAPMGRPALSLAPPSARSFRASEARNLAQKIRPNRLSPARPQRGRAGERRFPPSPPRLCGPRPPRRPCTLSPRSSTVTPESRS